MVAGDRLLYAVPFPPIFNPRGDAQVSVNVQPAHIPALKRDDMINFVM
jgi:hypothetical protein